MQIVVGLGNPGKKYENTRHNIGKTSVSIFADKYISSIDINKKHKKILLKYSSFIRKGIIENKQVVVYCPSVYMNDSGLCIQELVSFYHVDFQKEIIVVHDDITLPFGRVKISTRSGAGNHKGVQSIIDQLGSSAFIRVRIGIGRGVGILEKVVLSSFTHKEQLLLSEVIKKVSEALRLIIVEGVDRALTYVNRK